RPLMKSLRQSARSDFHREHWAAAPADVHRAARDSDIGAPTPEADRGIALTNYLLAKHVRNGATPESYETSCISLQRHDVGPDEVAGDDDDGATRVDVYEMYWADRSRLLAPI